MSLSQLQRPFAAVVSGFARPLLSSSLLLARERPTVSFQCKINAMNLIAEGRRNATVKAQGAYKHRPKRTHPKKMGAKRTGDQYVVPGNIIYKQYGTLWWPGENTIMGRDHTIHAAVSGYVKYYRDPVRHPDRKYIGVVFNKEDTLPYPMHAERKRRLGMAPVAKEVIEAKPEMSSSGIPNTVVRAHPHKPEQSQVLKLQDDYTYRESAWAIGRLVKTTDLQLKRFKSRRAFFRHRRWSRERYLKGMKKAAERQAEDGAEDEWVAAARAKAQTAGKSKGKKAKKVKGGAKGGAKIRAKK
ncbi:54S ribosomal protein L2, mitochondrial [Ceratocystis lukuohia]|uniref:Large ribosomal subunit protein bL27m n=3 Tax=Ceratocystis TaxID=5157 RepID=A0A2C5X0X1_9PEZI|nr:54S ribosomal protein L2, mitochondrial [Ceratocystis fimbriata CBS 114723]